MSSETDRRNADEKSSIPTNRQESDMIHGHRTRFHELTGEEVIDDADGVSRIFEPPDAPRHGEDGDGTDRDMSTAVQHPDLAALMREWWEREEPLWEEIVQKGGFQKYLDALGDNAEQAFYNTLETSGLCACCIDEAVRVYRSQQEHRRSRLINIAGSGILPFEDETIDPMDDAYITHVARQYIDTGVTVVTSHHGCGAALAARKSHQSLARGRLLTEKEEKALESDQAGTNAFAREWTMKVVSSMKKLLRTSGRQDDADAVTYDEITFEMQEGMQRPEKFHVARVIYYDGTDLFDPSFPKLPQGFVVSRKSLGPRKGIKTAALAQSIATGAHGYGELFTEEEGNDLTKLWIVCISDPFDHSCTEETLRKEVGSWLARLPEEKRKRMRVDAFSLPRLTSVTPGMH